MTEAARKRAVYQDLFDIPENKIGEIINGELIVTPRPSRKQRYVASSLGYEIGPPYHFGRGGGSGGWIILDEPHDWISIVPDWVCEILSPGTARVDRTEKNTFCAQHQVSHARLIDRILKTLEAFQFEPGRWVVLGVYAKSAKVRAEPSTETELDLGLLWLE